MADSAAVKTISTHLRVGFPTAAVAVNIGGFSDQVRFTGRIEAEIKLSCPVAAPVEPCRIRVEIEPVNVLGIGDTNLRYRVLGEFGAQFTGNLDHAATFSSTHRVCVRDVFFPVDPCQPMTVNYRFNVDGAGRVNGLVAALPGTIGVID